MKYAVSTSVSLSQWVDLGIQTEACMTQPKTCGAAGGAVSFWVRLLDCPGLAGIITTRKVKVTDGGPAGTGFHVGCRKNEIIW